MSIVRVNWKFIFRNSFHFYSINWSLSFFNWVERTRSIRIINLNDTSITKCINKLFWESSICITIVTTNNPIRLWHIYCFKLKSFGFRFRITNNRCTYSTQKACGFKLSVNIFVNILIGWSIYLQSVIHIRAFMA